MTGFGPFPGIPRNASELLVRGLTREANVNGTEVAAAVIPVVWDEARAAAQRAIAGFEPHAVLHFGVSKRASAFEIETRAFNMSGPKKDHAGVVRPPVALVHAGQPTLSATLPPLDLIRSLRTSGHPAVLSRDPGRYLCNALFYWSLADGADAGRLVGFVHMPAFGIDTAVKSRFTMEEAIAAGRILVRASSEAVLRAKQSRESQRGGSNGHGSETFHRNGRGGSRAVWRDTG